MTLFRSAVVMSFILLLTLPLISAPGEQSFIAVKQKETGRCVVVVGVKGISAGDKVFGTFSTYTEAKKTLDAQCGKSQDAAAKTGLGKTQTLTCEDKENLEGGCCCFKGTHTYLFDLERVSSARLIFDTGKGVNCHSNMKIEVKEGDAWRGVATIAAVSSRGSDQSNRIRKDIPIDADIQGIRLSDGCACCLDYSSVTLNPSDRLPPPSTVQAGSQSQFAGAFTIPILALPKYDNDDSTKGIFYINLDTGNAFFIDRVKHSPLSVRSRTLNQNVFRVLGRTPGMPVKPGKILAGEIQNGGGTVFALLLVDTSTGAMGYITDLGSKSYRGRIKVIPGHPAADIGSDDGNYALIMRRGSSGKTKGAYLYHLTTGECLYFGRINELKTNPPHVRTTTLPALSSGGSAVGLQAGSEATTHILIMDAGTGDLYHVGGLERRSSELSPKKDSVTLFTLFPRERGDISPRFTVVPLFSGSGETKRLFIVDGVSGKIALLENARNRKKMRLVAARGNIYDHLPKRVGRRRVLTAVPKVKGDGATEGAWLFDSATGRILFIDRINNPRKVRIRPVTQAAR